MKGQKQGFLSKTNSKLGPALFHFKATYLSWGKNMKYKNSLDCPFNPETQGRIWKNQDQFINRISR